MNNSYTYLENILEALDDDLKELVDWSIHNEDKELDQINQLATDFEKIKKTLNQ